MEVADPTLDASGVEPLTIGPGDPGDVAPPAFRPTGLFRPFEVATIVSSGDGCRRGRRAAGNCFDHLFAARRQIRR
jgi:hypothetical protein